MKKLFKKVYDELVFEFYDLKNKIDGLDEASNRLHDLIDEYESVEVDGIDVLLYYTDNLSKVHALICDQIDKLQFKREIIRRLKNFVEPLCYSRKEIGS